MAFDKTTRNALARMVAVCRSLLNDDIREQLRAWYLIQPDGTALAVERLEHLDDRGRQIARDLRQWLDHLAATESGTEAERRNHAVFRMVQESSFTYLNRLAALRMCEERGLILESVCRGLESDGFALYEQVAGQALGDRGDTYRMFLECLFDELAVDLGVLFDRRQPHSLVFPSPTCISAVLEQLNSQEFRNLWDKDEMIGWIYQFFNSDDERKEMRKKSAAPRNTRELAVRNQFFTPRYVVEFLTDNTLGRTWYEMCHGHTSLLEQMDYFVSHEHEVFLPQGKQPQPSTSERQDLSKEELLQTQVQIAYRPKKDPRDIKLLDPACGSGHFLLYSFDLFQTIYVEAWRDELSPPSTGTGRTLRDDYDSEEALQKEIPELILLHNLYGIDIDQRACQIAALALWLRAQRRFKELKVSSRDRRRITRTNIVCAEPMPGEEDLLNEFADSLRPPILGQLVRSIFKTMELAAEAGSLLKIEQEIRGPLAKARKDWQAQSERARDKKGREMLFSQGEMDRISRSPQLAFDLSGITDDEFWTEAEPRILADLERYATTAENEKAVQRTLFADDAEQGFAFVDVCRQRYDVVLMNPPFGDASLPSKPYIDDHYGDTKGDVFKAFVEAFQDRLVPNGMLGIISSRTAFFKRTSKDWREQVILRFFRPLALADLGYFVLDAKVETAAYVLRSLRTDEREELTFSFLSELKEMTAADGSPFSAARYCDHRKIKRYQAEQELRWLEDKGYIRAMQNRYVQYQLINGAIEAARAPIEPYYPRMLCCRLLTEKHKENTLGDAIADINHRESFVINPDTFMDLPGHSFAYWLPIKMREHFRESERFENDGRIVRVGLQTSDDFRFVRAWWEPPASKVCPSSQHPKTYSGAYCVTGDYRWFPFSKGGKYSPFYAEIVCAINWHRDGEELKAWAGSLYDNSHWSRIIKNVAYFFRPGITYSSRNTVRFGGFPLPAGSVFGHLGPALFLPTEELVSALGQVNSYVVDGFLSVWHGQGVESQSHRKTYEVGMIQHLPWKSLESQEFDELLREGHRLVVELRNVDETSRFFISPKPPNDGLPELLNVLWNVDLAVAKNYGVELCDLFVKGGGLAEIKKNAQDEMRKALKLAGGFPDKKMQAHNQLSYALGCVFGRWDLRYALGTRKPPEPAEPFDPLPICSPGMLTGEDGLPASSAPDDYPIEITWEGVLVDDPGLDDNHPHHSDIVLRIRSILTILHGSRAEAIEQELCDALKVDALRDYFRSPTHFLERHRKNYSRGGRSAPIYWPLSTKTGLYTLWLYYPRLSHQTLYHAINHFVVPKIDQVSRRLTHLNETLQEQAGRGVAELRQESEACRMLLIELEEFREELLRVAGLPYHPDLNDGVMITAAPFWQLILHNTWAQKLKACWKSLSDGEFDWAHLAYSIWPERVRRIAEGHLSIAIAHGFATGVTIEDLVETADESDDIELPDDELDEEEDDE
jgi:hypothetical protein